MGGGRDVENAPQIPRYGFDEYVSTWESPDPDKKITASNWIWSNDDEVKRWERTAYFVDKALDFLSRHKGEPCFVNLWPDDMHTPWVQGQEVVDNETSWTTDPNFREVLKEYDKQIGRFMEGLKKLGLDANTIVIFTSDNGPAPSFEQIRTNSMRGQKASLYEGGIRMPFIIRWPGTIPAGKVDNENVVCSVDLFPTLCKIAGADLPKNYTLDGEDMSTALLGKGVQARTKDLMWEFGYQQFLAPKKKARSPHLAIRRGEWKLLVNSDGSQKELYNIKTDINESQNVAADHPDLVEEMSAKVLNWWQTKRKTPNNQ